LGKNNKWYLEIYMTDILTAQIQNQAELIKEEVLTSIRSLDAIKEKIGEISITRRTFGKTVDEWNTELSVQVDPQADPARTKYYLSRLSGSLDTAYRNLTRTKIMYSQYKLSYIPALSNEISLQANHKGRKVVPAMETMSRVAENSLGDRSVAVIEFETFIDFWTDMVWKIRNQVDIVKTICMSNGTMYRVGEVYTGDSA
jgi:hypothetical protein